MTKIEALHPTIFITEELEARGWTLSDLAKRMGHKKRAHHKLVLDMYFLIGPENTNCRIGQITAYTLAAAFSVSPKLFISLENEWLRSKGVVAA